MYTLVQQIENNLLVPKIQGDAVELHPGAVMFALVIGGAIAGLLGAILALPIPPRARDVFRYLFRRLSPGPGPAPPRGPIGSGPARTAEPMPDRSTHTRCSRSTPKADAEVIQAAYRRLARKYHPDLHARRRGDPDGRDQRGVGTDRGAGEAPGIRPRARAETTRAPSGAADPSAAAPAAHRPAGLDDGGARRVRVGAGTSGRRRRGTPSGRTLPSRRPSRATGRRAVRPRWRVRRVDARREGFGAAGQPPGNPSGTVLNFGRYAGWSLGEVARKDLEYIEWLDRAPIGRNYREEIDQILRRAAGASLPMPQTPNGAGCSAGASRHAPPLACRSSGRSPGR